MAYTTGQTIAIWIQWVYLLFVTLFCLYMIIKFIRVRHELHIKIRVPTFTYIFCTSMILMPPGRMFLDAHNCPFKWCELNNDGSFTQIQLVQDINSISFGVRLTLMTASFSMKLWYLFYALKLQTLLINGKWWTQINENLSKNWWIKNADKYGKVNKITWIIISAWLIILTSFVIIVGIARHSNISRVIGYLQIMIVAIASTLFYCKIPKINDIYGIKKEIKAVIIIEIWTFLWFPITEFASGTVNASHLFFII